MFGQKRLKKLESRLVELGYILKHRDDVSGGYAAFGIAPGPPLNYPLDNLFGPQQVPPTYNIAPKRFTPQDIWDRFEELYAYLGLERKTHPSKTGLEKKQ